MSGYHHRACLFTQGLCNCADNGKRLIDMADVVIDLDTSLLREMTADEKASRSNEANNGNRRKDEWRREAGLT